MVFKVNHNQLNVLIKELHKKKTSLFVYGTFGIGKSFVVRDVAKEIAKEQNLIFVEYMKITKEEKLKLLKNPEKYFVLIDVRLSEFDITDIKGLPIMDNEEFLSWKIDLWGLLTQNKKSRGLLFLDEMNLANQMVLSTSYKILNDRIIGDSAINDNWGIIGAGNMLSDKAFTFDLPFPLRDRCCECELNQSDIQDFTKYMARNNFRKEIIGFLNTHPSYLRVVNDDDEKIKNTTTRGWERLNNLIKDVQDYKSELFSLLCHTAISETIASDFIAYCKIQDKFKVEDYIKNPKKLLEIKGEDSLSIKYFFITSVADLYNTDKIDYKKLIEIIKVFDKMNNPEFVVLLFIMLVEYDDVKFNNDLMKDKTSSDIIVKYSKYIN